MLLIHGFAGSGVLFYKLVSQLRHYFNITTIDLLGMGCSGRPAYDGDKIYTTPELAIDFFLDSIEAWMKATKYREKVG